MDPRFAFSTASTIAMLGWLGLLTSLFVPIARDAVWRTTRLFIPALFGVAYVVLIWQGWSNAVGAGFGSIEQVRALFAVDAALVAGWLHYLAFDLFVGNWIIEDGLTRRINRFALIPCLGLTFLFGPAGLLLYLGLRLLPPQEAT
ncbi:abscisic acid-deficient protein Aba4 family protein [Mesorhizobium sp. M00.F.Ca.ET.216.01.1.1]|uniref:abscisic acid-deficient protein Aba4 family protein n=1 Tax=Mesorhizobium sp. M00.F.Ca.ET.216.01.1.1 TaxID=2500528 RepID=UPI00247B26E5|nr:abscisic acid-deficient protein Aba4 family protein [Mesorhizobium sp. M00.F.Ca.ET.216.01.1.1]